MATRIQGISLKYQTGMHQPSGYSYCTSRISFLCNLWRIFISEEFVFDIVYVFWSRDLCLDIPFSAIPTKLLPQSRISNSVFFCHMFSHPEPRVGFQDC